MVCFRYINVNTGHKGDNKDDDDDDDNNTRKVPNQVATTNKSYWALHRYFEKYQCT